MGRAFDHSAEYPSQEIAVITKIKPVISGTTTLKSVGGKSQPNQHPSVGQLTAILSYKQRASVHKLPIKVTKVTLQILLENLVNKTVLILLCLQSIAGYNVPTSAFIELLAQGGSGLDNSLHCYSRYLL